MAGEMPSDGTTDSIEPGSVVYDGEGTAVGVVSGLTTEGFEVRVPEGEVPADGGLGDDGGSPTGEAVPGQSFGEGYLMWRCDECGEMGDVDGGPPEACPNCGAPKQHLYRVQED